MNRKENILRILISAAALCFIVIGIANGEHREILGKAVRICLECIGVG